MHSWETTRDGPNLASGVRDVVNRQGHARLEVREKAARVYQKSGQNLGKAHARRASVTFAAYTNTIVVRRCQPRPCAHGPWSSNYS